MSIVKDRVGEVFDESLPRLLEFLEGVVGQHQQWNFIRKVTLKQVNVSSLTKLDRFSLTYRDHLKMY